MLMRGSESTWARKLRFWLTDDQYDSIIDSYPDDNWRWKAREFIEVVGLKVLCFVYGHGVIDDQCCIPEHRFCFRCSKSMPNQPVANYKWF